MDGSVLYFLGSPLIIRVPFFLLFGFNKGTQKEKGEEGTTGEPSKRPLHSTQAGTEGFNLRGLLNEQSTGMGMLACLVGLGFRV